MKKPRPTLHYGTQSIRLLPPQCREEVVEIESFMQQRGVNGVPEAERDERLGLAGAIWHTPARASKLWK